MSVCTRWWLRLCLKCQALRTPRLSARRPVILLPLPPGPSIAVSVDNFEPLPVKPRGNTYILLFTDRFSRRGDIFAVTAAEFTAEGMANILINRYVAFSFTGAHVASSRTTVFSSTPSFPTSYMSLAFEKSPPAPTIQAVTVVRRVLTT